MVKMDFENNVKDEDEKEKCSEKSRYSKNSSSFWPFAPAEGHAQRKTTAAIHGKQILHPRRPLGKWRPPPLLPRKISRKPKTTLREDSQQASNRVE